MEIFELKTFNYNSFHFLHYFCIIGCIISYSVSYPVAIGNDVILASSANIDTVIVIVNKSSTVSVTVDLHYDKGGLFSSPFFTINSIGWLTNTVNDVVNDDTRKSWNVFFYVYC